MNIAEAGRGGRNGGKIDVRRGIHDVFRNGLRRMEEPLQMTERQRFKHDEPRHAEERARDEERIGVPDGFHKVVKGKILVPRDDENGGRHKDDKEKKPDDLAGSSALLLFFRLNYKRSKTL